jgi:hypothetical protein
LIPPGVALGHSVFLNATPDEARLAVVLEVLAVLNSRTLDWIARQLVGSNVTLPILRGLPVPALGDEATFLSHCALRLTCNHAGYAPLWRERLGEAWREPKPPFIWPVLGRGAFSSAESQGKEDLSSEASAQGERWAVRAAIDAVVAHAYGLTRDQYAHVLSTFSHASCPDTPPQCLAAFDELQSLDLEAFTQKHDPYWNIPLNENLPQPVVELPQVASGEQRAASGASTVHQKEFDLPTTAARAGSRGVFAESFVAWKRSPKRRKGSR